jgi:bifunctional DNA-binding transcriptional regulator/antitoxin component of YhaV-PrlF toxin-antitoxin module
MPKISSNNKITIPAATLRAAGLCAGDEVTVRPIGHGQLVVAARVSRVRLHAGIAKGLYRDGELDRLRDDWAR